MLNNRIFKTSCTRAADTIMRFRSPPRPASGDTIYVSISCHHYNVYCLQSFIHYRSPLLYVHVGLPVQPTKMAWWSWSLTFWPWKWCPSHVWRSSPGNLCANCSLPRSLFSGVRTDVRDRQTESDVRQKHHLIPRLRWRPVFTLTQALALVLSNLNRLG